MYLLDTNTVNLVLRNPTPYLQARITAVPATEIYISVVGVEEILKGVLGPLHANRKTPAVTRHYSFLKTLIGDLCVFQVLAYDEAAEAIYQGFSATVRRVGLADCRIAASAMAQNPQYTVITRNLSDFRTTGALCENWIDPPNE
ncbi:MAG TPA: hypothetical protein VES69_07990 [Pyrinomonadaceae bacterium]|nr:hypothetical protein [Pyrinomonadaceae bacterium]